MSSSSLARLADALDEWATKFGSAVLVAGTHFEGVLILGPPGTETDPQAFTSRQKTLGAEIIELSERVIPELVSAGKESLAASLLQAVDQFRKDRAFSRFEALRPQLRVAAVSQQVSPAKAPPSLACALPTGAQQGEGEKRPDAHSAKQLLHGWRAIDEALGLSRSYPNMNYDERRRKLAYLNRRFGGPIKAGGKGRQPVVNRSELIAWWNSLEDQVEDQKARIRDKQATLQSRHQYGRAAQVAPDLGGSVKRRKSRSQT